MTFRLTLEDVADMMDGHFPPSDPAQEDGYWRVFLQRAHATFTEDEMTEAYLLAGGMPDEFTAWERRRQAAGQAEASA